MDDLGRGAVGHGDVQLLQLDVELLKRNIDWTHIDDIELQGGEPLAMKNAKEIYVWLTEEKGSYRVADRGGSARD